MSDIYEKLLICADLSSLESMEEDFNNVGLTLQQTVSDKVILCRIENGKPCADVIFEDYMIIGYARECARRISKDTRDSLMIFVARNKGKPAKVIEDGQSYGNQSMLYADNGIIVDDHVGLVMQAMREKEAKNHKMAEADLIKTLSERYK